MESVLLYYGQFMELSKANPIVASVLATGVSGSLFMILRRLPQRIINRVRRLFVHSILLEFPQQTWEYRAFQEFISKEGFLLSRNFTVKRMGTRKEPYLVNSVGHQYWFYGGNLWSIGVGERDSQGITEQKYSMKLRVYALSRKPLERLMLEVSNKMKAAHEGRYSYHDTDTRTSIPKRPISSVILNQGVWEQITDTIDRFLSSEEWYIAKGVPYKLTIMLAGPPGTGKSSIVAAIVSHYGGVLFNASISLRDGTNRGAREGRMGFITVMEDIEHHELFKNTRRAENGEESTIVMSAGITMTEFLNQLSGTGSRHGSVTIMTSNDLSVLPEQLLRPGRTDLIVEVGYLNQEAIGRYVEHVYDESYEIHPNTPPHRASYLQTVFLDHLNDPERFIETISKPEPIQEQRSYLQDANQVKKPKVRRTVGGQPIRESLGTEDAIDPDKPHWDSGRGTALL